MAKTPMQGMSRRELQRMAATPEPGKVKAESRSICLRLDMPPSANRYWRQNPRGGVYVSEEAIDYKSDVAVLARQQGVREPIAGDVCVTVRVYRKQRSGDLDNRLKVLLDSLKGIAFEDDKQVAEIHAFRFEDKHDPRVEVEITNSL